MVETKKEKMLVIVGPTASGKTSLSISLAKKFNGEIISADSRQVYRGLDIGTEKISRKEMGGVPHYLIDVCDPEEVFSVKEFKSQASESISQITSKDKLPIIAGGTGFYVDALLYDMKFPEVGPNDSLRKELEEKSVEELYKKIEERDPERANSIDPNNKRRLVRALEVIDILGKVPMLKNKGNRYDALIIGIQTSNEILRKRIENRLSETIINGLVQETLSLIQNGVLEERLNEFGLEYRIALEFISGKLKGSEMKGKMLRELWHYAKRQRTWFKRNKDILWFKLEDIDEIEERVREFLKQEFH